VVALLDPDRVRRARGQDVDGLEQQDDRVVRACSAASNRANVAVIAPARASRSV
jgi:hypothetical protein